MKDIIGTKTIREKAKTRVKEQFEHQALVIKASGMCEGFKTMALYNNKIDKRNTLKAIS